MTVFYGENAQGKTNLLESIYLLATLKSFRGARNADLLRHGAERGSVEGTLHHAGLARVHQVQVDKGGKRFRIDGKNPRGLPEYFAGIKAIAFVPSDVRLADGAPDGRREFLDRAAFTLDPAYLGIAKAYATALKQKNALIRDAKRRRRSPDPLLLGAWNDRLADAGAEVIERRVGFLRDFAPVFREIHGGITGGVKGRPEIRYRGAVSARAIEGGRETIREALRAKIEAAKDSELSRGFALVGPQRDDWVLTVGGEPLRTLGSQGQLRSAALALRLAQMVLTRRTCGVCPIFLLDDVGSELDPLRNRRLLEQLGELEAQVLITTTTLANLQLPSEMYSAYRVENGSIRA
jgi:DNA replication and repair protein RecF